MTAKEYLQQYRTIDREIGERCEEIMRLRARAEKVTQTLTGMPGGGRKSDWTDIVARIVELTDEMDERSRQLRETGIEIERQLAAMKDATERRCLRLRYVDGYTWTKIAGKLHYSYRGAINLHHRALDHFSAQYESVHAR